MTSVITEQQARKITGGRKPLVPVEYESAVKALQACLTLDEAKYWSDKSDALAAWAKIYRSDEASRKARALKLHAFRRMGILAGELRPKKILGGKGGALPGPHSILVEQGLTESHAKAARVISKMPQKTFEALVDSPNPPSLSAARATALNDKSGVSDSWLLLVRGYGTGVTFASVRTFCRKHSAKLVARGLNRSEVDEARKLVTEVAEWIDQFEQYLPKSKK